MSHRLRIVAAILLFLGIGALLAQSALGPPSVLTVEQTMDVAFLRLMEGVPWDLYRRSNPAAADGLRKIVANQDLRPYHVAAWRMLGFVGQEADVARVKNFLEKPPEPVFDLDTFREIAAVLQCLGELYGRDVPGSRDLMMSTLDLDYWRQGPYNSGALAAPGTIPIAIERFSAAAEGYALSGKNEFDEMIKKASESISEQQPREYMIGRSSPDRLKRVRENMLKVELGQSALRPAAGLFNGDMANPRPKREAPSRTAATEISTPNKSASPVATSRRLGTQDDLKEAESIRKEAEAAYAEIKAKILVGDFESLKGKLLDDGAPVIPQANWDELLRDLAKERTILESDAMKAASVGTIHIEDNKVFDLAANSSSTTAGRLTAVSWQLVGSAPLGKENFPRVPPNSLTVAADGTLKVVMKKINGQWYWNPFGW